MSVLGTAAAVASFFIPGGQTGAFAMYAYGIGSTVETLVNPPTVEGPRLDDLKTQLSTYGAPIPFEYGTNRHAGTIIWPKTLTAVESKHEESGKGGPDQVTYTYALSLAVLVCEGPIAGIRRIWANKKIIYDVSSTITGATTDPAVSGLRIYLGTETQTADPLITAQDGASPAYLGYAYVVFENYDVTEWGGRAPQFEFEVLTSAISATATPPTNLGNGGATTIYLPGTANAQVWTTTGTNAYCYDPVTGALLATVALPYEGKSITVVNNRIWVGYEETGLSTALASAIDPVSFTIVDSTKFGYGGAIGYLGTVAWNPTLGLLYSFANNGIGAGARYYKPADSTTGISGITTPHFVYTTVEMPLIQKLAGAGYGNWLIVASMVTDTTIATITNSAWGASAQSHRIVYDATRNCLYWSYIENAGVYKVDLTTYALTLHISVTPQGLHYSDDTGIIYVDNGTALDLYNADTGLLIASYAGYGVLAGGTTRGNSVDGENGEYYFVSEFGSPPGKLYKVMIGGRISPLQVSLSSIVSNLCTRANLLTSDIDVTALTDLVDGYIVPRQMTARAAIEPLQQAYYFDPVESDDKIKFVKRGGAIAATIPKDDRAAREDGQGLPDALSIVRAFEHELPVECDVEYPDVNADHLTGNQYERRITKDTKQKINLPLAIVMPNTKAKQIARVTLYQAWLNQTYRWATTRKYAYLEPTDVVYLPTDQVTYAARITSKREQPNGVIEWEGRMEDSAIYTQSGSDAGATGYLSQTIFVADPTILALLDIPLMRDEDDNAGYYVAMGGQL